MPKNHTEVYVSSLPDCDFCKEKGKKVKALYDGRILYGMWANMCQTHFKSLGVGLGLGKGQKLILKEEKKDE